MIVKLSWDLVAVVARETRTLVRTVGSFKKRAENGILFEIVPPLQN